MFPIVSDSRIVNFVIKIQTKTPFRYTRQQETTTKTKLTSQDVMFNTKGIKKVPGLVHSDQKT